MAATVEGVSRSGMPGDCPDQDVTIDVVVRMVAQQSAICDVLPALCAYAGFGAAAAFLRMDTGEWTVAARSGAARPVAAALGAIDPERLLNRLLEGKRCGSHRDEACDSGWGRVVASAAGEIVGVMLGWADGPALPWGECARRFDSACSLAAVAIEQSNLLAEAGLRPASAQDLLMLFRRAQESEALWQEVNRLIVQQHPPEEVLDFLCRKMGHTDTERQVAFFRFHGDQWRLAAEGDLSPEAAGALAVLDPAQLSQALFESEGPPNREERPVEHGWARHLYSGAGELLGMVVGFAHGPVLPFGVWATRIESVCRLATVAIEQHNLIAELAYKADFDALTSLPNRAFYDRALRAALPRNKRTGEGTALLLINLDRFRMINDVMGAAIGDQILAGVARRLEACLREKDLVARVGGDEFGVLLADYTRNDAGQVAERILRSLATSFSIDGHEIYVSASIGIGCSTPESTPEALRRKAYVALYQAKQTGKGRYVHFSASMSGTQPERLEMEKRLRQALARGEFHLHFQPQIDLASGRVCGAEALLRWDPEGLGRVSPGAFIPILEETGLMLEVGRWVLNEACRLGRTLAKDCDLRIGVNVSAVQFVEPDFPEVVRAVLAETGFPAGLLELELTESLFVGDFAAAAAVLERLRRIGIQLALDDFGTGQSSLSYVHRLAFHRLKIDQSFVRPANHGHTPPLLETIVQMAGNLGLETIAEGVETTEQADLLRSMGCGEAQGFLYAPGLPPDKFAEFVAGLRNGAAAI